jgi:endoglucanase
LKRRISLILVLAAAGLISACGSSVAGPDAAHSGSTTGATQTSQDVSNAATVHAHQSSTANSGGRSTPSVGSGATARTGPLAGFKLWVDPDMSAAIQSVVWRRRGRNRDAALINQIAAQPSAVWLTSGPPRSQVAAIVSAAQSAHAVAQIVLYNIPHRDCGQYSAGGAPTGRAYLAWVGAVAKGLGDHRVILILEPDAIDQAVSGCIGAAGASERYGLLANATKLLLKDPNARIYLDAGDAGWLSPEQIFHAMYLSGVAYDAGFSLNVANFYSIAQSIIYGRELSGLLQSKHFVIDTSRNGNGPPSAAPGVNRWCNPPGRALGQVPTTQTGNSLVDAFLWIKDPGESDGACRPGEPPAGVWWPAYALSLVRNKQASAR